MNAAVLTTVLTGLVELPVEPTWGPAPVPAPVPRAGADRPAVVCESRREGSGSTVAA